MFTPLHPKHLSIPPPYTHNLKFLEITLQSSCTAAASGLGYPTSFTTIIGWACGECIIVLLHADKSRVASISMRCEQSTMAEQLC